MCLAEHWAQCPAGTVAVCLWRDGLCQQSPRPTGMLSLGLSWGRAWRPVLWQCGVGRAGSPCGRGVQSNGVMPSWHHEKQEKAEVTRSKKFWCQGLGGGQPPAGDRL